MELLQILPVERWSEIENNVFDKFNLQGSVFNTEGIRITQTKNWSNRLCPVIKSTDKGQSFICAVAHMNMANQARQSRQPVIEECDAGILKLVVPIFFNDEYLGVIGGCGLLAEDGEIDVFAINKITEIAEEKIEALSSDIQTITHESAQSACEYIGHHIEIILNNYSIKG
ncbi:MAG: PocR ligand-binding domain-containing protein [Desulfobacula sp.]|jgi:ligand-binding sensor protein|nr:PocR ligand-binding domain-containing protein [Desulfobacula sp.]